MRCIYPTTRLSGGAATSGPGHHWKLGSFLTVVIGILLSDLAVVTLVSPILDQLPFLIGAFLEAIVAAAIAAPVLYHLTIVPFRTAVASAEKKARSVLEAAPEGIIEVASDGRIHFINAEVSKLFGYGREELIGKKVEILLPHRYRESHVRTREQYAADPHTRPMGGGIELTGRKNTGEEFPVEVSLSAFQEAESLVTICVVRDVSSQRAAKNEITRINERLTESLTAHKLLSETLGRLSDFGELLQSCRTRAEAFPIMARMCESLFPGQGGSVFLTTASKTALERAITWNQLPEPKQIIALHECWALRRGKMHSSKLNACDGCRANAAGQNIVCVPMVAQGDMIGVLQLTAAESSAPSAEPNAEVFTAVVERISVAIANLRLREELRDQAIRDTLTGLFNRRFLEEYLELELLRAMRNNNPITVMMLDVDHFKRFNDTFGHRAGDLVLREVAAILRTQVRGSDIACRFGGEELVVVCLETSYDQAIPRAEQIREAIESLTVIDAGQPLGKVTISIGVASAPEHGFDMTELLRAADEALYAAKSDGRNRVVRAVPPAHGLHGDTVRAQAVDVPAGLEAIGLASQRNAALSV